MVWQFSLDKYLNRHCPPSILPKLPHTVSRWLGHHHPHHPVSPKPDYLIWLDVMIGTFAGILTVEGIFLHSSVFKEHHSPILIASYGATAILLFNVNQVPLAQPRNIFFGQFLSAVIGVIMLKLFELSESGKEHLYVGAALSTAIASVLMSILGCLHPPSGATALIPLVDPEIAKMGWWYIPNHLVSSVVIIGVGLITNNVMRRYPVYWWTSYKRPPIQELKAPEADVEMSKTNDTIVNPDLSTGVITMDTDRLVITKDALIVPECLELTDVEYQILNTLKLKLAEDEEDSI